MNKNIIRKEVNVNLMDTISQPNESEIHIGRNGASDVASLYDNENQNHINKSQKDKDNKSAKRKRHHKPDNDSTGLKSPQDDKDVYYMAAFDEVNLTLKIRRKPLESTSTTLNNMSFDKEDREYKSSTMDPEKSKCEHTSSSSINARHSPPLKVRKLEREADTFDSSMGVNFEDVLKALDMPAKNSQKKRKQGGSSFNSDVVNEISGSKTAFTASSSEPATFSPEPVHTVTEDEAITLAITKRTNRTKICSGVRTGQKPAKIDIFALKYTGGVKFECLKPTLERITPQQLYAFEEDNPHIMTDTDILWQQHVWRNYRTKERRENESWREMYSRCREEEARRLSALNDIIKTAHEKEAAAIRKTQIAFANGMVKPPRNVLKIQKQHGTEAKLVATPAARVSPLSRVAPNVTKSDDPRLKVPSTKVCKTSVPSKKAPLMKNVLRFINDRFKR